MITFLKNYQVIFHRNNSIQICTGLNEEFHTSSWCFFSFSHQSFSHGSRVFNLWPIIAVVIQSISMYMIFRSQFQKWREVISSDQHFTYVIARFDVACSRASDEGTGLINLHDWWICHQRTRQFRKTLHVNKAHINVGMFVMACTIRQKLKLPKFKIVHPSDILRASIFKHWTTFYICIHRD